MKKVTFILLLAGTILFSNVQAQIDRGGETTSKKETGKDMPVDPKKDNPDKADVEKKAKEMAADWTKMMDDKLSLSADQEKKAMTVNMKYAKQLVELKMKHHNNPGASEAAIKTEKDRITEARLKEYKGFLNKEQMAKFNEHRSDLKEDKMSKEEKKEKIENMTPEEKEKLKAEKEKRKAEKSSN
ncbi:MAG: hypothetical protein H7Y00_03645 [Fimbriimonadaceae bacterium]|nr:hypothetical protein [Chitinophagales bacterium]